MNKFLQRTASLVALGTIIFSVSVPAMADQYDAQVNQLSSQIATAQSQIQQLSQQADSLQRQINLLNDQISALQAQINLNTVKAAKLNDQITQTKAELEQQKQVLGASMRSMYREGDTTPVEMLVASSSISDFINGQEYRTRVTSKIDDTVAKINALKADLDKQLADLTTVMNNQKAQQQALASAEAQQQQLLADTQGQEANYKAVVAAHQQQLQAIYSARAALDRANNIRVSTGGSGGYPFANYVPDSGSDPWGFYYRECVSYVAWKRRAVGRSPYPLYWGNAGDWAYAVPTTSTPSVGAIAVFPPGVQGAGSVGHVAYVESVNDNGTINISEYNWTPYSYDSRSGLSPAGIRFIQ